MDGENKQEGECENKTRILIVDSMIWLGMKGVCK